jgi:hypothetical protein
MTPTTADMSASADRSHWTWFPQESVASVMQFLERKDLIACRQVSKAVGGEASRCFSKP